MTTFKEKLTKIIESDFHEQDTFSDFINLALSWVQLAERMSTTANVNKDKLNHVLSQAKEVLEKAAKMMRNKFSKSKAAKFTKVANISQLFEIIQDNLSEAHDNGNDALGNLDPKVAEKTIQNLMKAIQGIDKILQNEVI